MNRYPSSLGLLSALGFSATIASAALFGAVAPGCGGKAVVDGTGAGGEGGTSTVTTSSVTSTTQTWTTTTTPTGTPTGSPTGTPTGTYTTTGSWTTTTTLTGDCEAMANELLDLIATATSCNACMDYDSCWDGPKITDLCGCPIGASSMQPDAVEQADWLYGQWVDMGCGPWDCGQPCFGEQTPYVCIPNGSGCGGHCEPAIN